MHVYATKPEFIELLCQELGSEVECVGNLVLSSQLKLDVCFALDIWHDAVIVEFNSISEAAAILRKAGKYWYLHPIENVRRSRLIEEQLRKLPPLTREFPINEPLPEIGCFTLLDKNTLVYSAKRWKKWPMGVCHFIEDKKNPPNRAYLKLWEALSLLEQYPKADEMVLDLGASPGGWTYVAQQLGASVIAVDKAELDPAIMRLPRVKLLQQSAFALKPESFDHPIDWLLCDVACYPERLYEFLLPWIASKKVKQFICTIKLQGKNDLESIKPFQAIPNARVTNLYYNKHEATFFLRTE